MEVLVMTPQILLQNLQHCFIKMDHISLLIFDECHHAQVKSSHPYAQIMKVFYETNGSKLPRIFGMTASPVVGKGAFQKENLAKSINGLETLLNAKVYSVENNDELDSFVASPIVRVYYYGSATNDDASCSNLGVYQNKLEEIKRQCVVSLKGKTDNTQSHQSLMNMKKLLKRTHDNIISTLESLGLWGALQATRILLNSDHSAREELMGENQMSNDHSPCDMYLSLAARALSSDFVEDEVVSKLSSVEVLKDPFFSRKLLRLIGILSSFRLQPNMKCIIFVNRIVIARSLTCILKNLTFLSSWKSDFLVGVNCGLKSISRNSMNAILERFRSGELNLLVATKVGEEGLDIQTCCLVIRFDLPETVSSFIQSRGRARMPQSEYAFLVNRASQKEMDLIKNFKNDEDQMNEEITARTTKDTFPRLDEKIYRVDQTRASVSAGSSIALLYRYCSKLPHDEFFLPKPEFFFVDDLSGTICHLVLPSNAPFHKIVSLPQPSSEAAKKDACLKAVGELHKLGVLNAFLLPESNDEIEDEFIDDASDSDSIEGQERSRNELYEMLVPSLFKQKWDNSMDCVGLHSYYIKFVPVPEDRAYRNFGLFIKSPLPLEGEGMELDLHLAHHRSVYVNLLARGITEFNSDEIRLAELFQEVALKAILERQELIPEFVPLGISDSSLTSISTFYLLLPINVHATRRPISVDWVTIKKCMSSPIFKAPSDLVEDVVPPPGLHVNLANGFWSINDVKNSLVFAIHDKLFYFVSDVFRERNGHSRFRESNESHAERVRKKYGIELKRPNQPLLLAKPVFHLRNLLHNRKMRNLGPHELEEYFIEIPPELCQLKIKGFSKDIGSSLSLLPSVMHRLENLLVAIELRDMLSASIPEAAEVAGHRVLEALTTEKCQERFSLERLEVLGDAFLKFVVSRRLFLLYPNLDEGELTRRRSNIIKNRNLFNLAIRSNLQVYIRDQPFDPCQFFAFGHPCKVACDNRAAKEIHSLHGDLARVDPSVDEIRCSKGHCILHKKTIADVVEALIGAFLVDTGFKGAIAFLRWIGIDVGFEPVQVIDACVKTKIFTPLSADIDLPALEGLLGYKFFHKGLLLQAFVHPSYNRHGGGCYQRLEFLGDAVLDYLITSYYFTVYPNLKPGELTDLRSLSVNNKAFANVAVGLSLDRILFCDNDFLRRAIKDYTDFLTMSPPASGLSEAPKCPKVLGDLVESCFGAMLLDSGLNLNKAWTMMLSLLDPVKITSNLQLCPIRALLELTQSRKWDKETSVTKVNGGFSVTIKLTKEDSSFIASAIGRSKKEGTRKASEIVVMELKAHGYITATNPLEKVLKDSSRMEAELIGYDEEPVDVTDFDVIKFGNLNLEESFQSYPVVTETKADEAGSSYRIKPVITGKLSETRERLSEQTVSEVSMPKTSETKGGSNNKTARSLLHEICVAHCWKSPDFQCCEEEGPGHLKSFVYKVIIVIEDTPDMTLECYGAAKPTKKGAAEHAAEAAIWYLEHAGYLH
ncbi:PREDICTED: dicer-like protein 4 [Tarenaya hassleriana]|uniref:dicer-like protein 4 n=1 Tax=Tarenaya hassleriana TaxID=28532 RepID=UPI0008FD4BD1|nr:PREDICTED: dicer-like protein 4 [Tarenaya hassleriana]